MIIDFKGKYPNKKVSYGSYLKTLKRMGISNKFPFTDECLLCAEYKSKEATTLTAEEAKIIKDHILV